MIPGSKVQFGDTEYVIPPLSIGQLKNGLLDDIKQHDTLLKESLEDQLKYVAEVLPLKLKIIHQAVMRNHPNLSLDDLGKIIDLANVNDIWRTVMGLTGLVQDEDTKPGEAGAEVAQKVASAGATSTAP